MFVPLNIAKCAQVGYSPKASLNVEASGPPSSLFSGLRNDLAVPSEPIHILLYLEPLIALIIIANGVSIGIQTDPLYEGWPYWMYVELGFVVLLSIENLTRTVVLGCRDFWCGAERGWNWFDSFVTSIGVADVSWQLLATDSPDIAGTLLLRCFRLVRLARVVRVFRLKIMSDLRLMAPRRQASTT